MKDRFLLEGKTWYLQGFCDWKEWLLRFIGRGRFNWYNLTLLQFSFEDEICTANRELMVYLLGFGFRLQWSTGGPSPALDIANERMAEIVAHPDCAVELSEILAERDESQTSASQEG